MIKQVEILDEIKDGEYFIDLLREILKSTFTPTKILSLAYLYKYREDTKKDEKTLLNIIFKDNLNTFKDEVYKNEISFELLEKLMLLDQPMNKKIVLDKKEIEKSRENLRKTLKSISEFTDAANVNPEESKKDIEEKINANKSPISLDTREILKEILEKEFIAKSEFENKAMQKGLFSKVYLSKINEELYEYTNDQTIIFDEDRIIIDAYYIDMIKELVNE